MLLCQCVVCASFHQKEALKAQQRVITLALAHTPAILNEYA